ncbi:MAG: hypothetical protein ACNA74_02975 [Desulfurivibrio sp.]
MLDMLTAEDPASSTELDELTSFLTQTPAPAAKPQGHGQRTKPNARKKRRATHYLAPETFERLERLLADIRLIMPENARKRLSRSSLVDSSMLMLMQDFEKNGENSRLVRWLLQELENGN